MSGERMRHGAAAHDTGPDDPFRWLENGGAREVSLWEEDQAALLDASLGRGGLREDARGHVAHFLEVGAYTPPVWRSGHAFYLRYEPGRDHPVLVRARGVGPGADKRARIVFDPAAWDPSGETVLAGWSPSPDGTRLALNLTAADGAQGRLAIVGAGAGTAVEALQPGWHHLPAAWLPGSNGFFYVRDLSEGRTMRRRAFLHRLGTPQEADLAVEGVPEDWLVQRIRVDPSGRWLMVQARGPRGTGVWAGELPPEPTRPAGLAAVYAAPRCSASFRGEGLLDVLTEHGAPRGRLLSVRLGSDPQWWESIPQRPDEVLVDSASLGRGPGADLLTVWRAEGASRLRLHPCGRDGVPLPQSAREVALPGVGTVLEVGTAQGEAWIGWTDFVTPPSVLRYRPGDRAARAVLTAPGAADPGDVGCERYEVPAEDGIPVRTFVLGPRGDRQPRAALLTVYGGFGLANTPVFSAAALAWVSAGGRWAMAAVRGGGEEGSRWREAARGRAKYRSVLDLHAVADFLLGAGLAAPGRLGLLGSSHGGLLAAAAAVDRPGAYEAAVCVAAPLDLLRFHLWPAGRAWIPEYGDPDDADDREALLRYSPYHNIRPGTRYPKMLLTAYELDRRVDPAHARKFCAALQAAQRGVEGSRALYALRSGQGHTTGAVSHKKAQAVDEFAFLAGALGLPLPGRKE